MLRVGIVGAGLNARTHVASFRRACLISPEVATSVSIDAVAGFALEPAQAFSKSMSIGKAFDDWRMIVDDPAIDLVDIATANGGESQTVADPVRSSATLGGVMQTEKGSP